MSTFLGLIEEIPGISVDRFDGENLNSSAYFLSHCHTDHMQGLNCVFFYNLKQKNKYFYCSKISKVILETMGYVIENVIEIDIDVKTEIKYESNSSDILYVTCISAGHCPGSVMFLFEKMDELILYTGDFRINPKDYRKLKSLHDRDSSHSSPKKLAKVYLDTTFLDRDFTSFPTRPESLRAMCKVVTEWLNLSPKNVVILECSALYGSEFLYMELSKDLNVPIHIKDIVYETYHRIPDLARCITLNPMSTRVHACMSKFDRSGLKCCQNISKRNILTIVPSVLKWKGKDTSKVGEYDSVRSNTYNVCYSTHASYHELETFIKYFKPDEIHPCVCPEDMKNQIFYLLDKIKS
ncbi:hypothetical protein PUN28_019529 [Cardiocondyla obscurior]|uniref:Protein artemis n=1 Tax=Cardiocondyla obscurior TaxID=286306 RepID=A0AAW2EET1_9HYME